MRRLLHVQLAQVRLSLRLLRFTSHTSTFSDSLLISDATPTLQQTLGAYKWLVLFHPPVTYRHRPHVFTNRHTILSRNTLRAFKRCFLHLLFTDVAIVTHRLIQVRGRLPAARRGWLNTPFTISITSL